MKSKEKKVSDADEEKSRTEKTKKVFRHPVRDRILSILRDGTPRTQRELGKILSMSNAAVRYHVKMLEEIGIIGLHSTRQGPNGITEKLYTTNTENWPPVSREDTEFYMDYVISWMNERHREGLSLLKTHPDVEQGGEISAPFIAGSYAGRSTISDMIQFKRDMEKLFDDFYKKCKRKRKAVKRADMLIPFAVTFSMLPSQEDNTAEDSRNILEFEPQR